MSIELQASDRWQAIDELIDHLVVTGRIDPKNRELIASAVRHREMSMSTGIGSGIATPYASTDLVSEVVQVTGLSEKGIDFAALDGKPVHKVCFFLVPTGKFQEFPQVLADMIKKLHRGEL